MTKRISKEYIIKSQEKINTNLKELENEKIFSTYIKHTFSVTRKVLTHQYIEEFH